MPAMTIDTYDISFLNEIGITIKQGRRHNSICLVQIVIFVMPYLLILEFLLQLSFFHKGRL